MQCITQLFAEKHMEQLNI